VLGPAQRRGASRAPPLLQCGAEAEACYSQGGGAAAAGGSAATGLAGALREGFDEFYRDFQAYPTYGDNVATTAGACRHVSHILHVLSPVSQGCCLAATDAVRRACLFAAYVRVFHRASQLSRRHHGGSASLAVSRRERKEHDDSQDDGHPEFLTLRVLRTGLSKNRRQSSCPGQGCAAPL
ncbi:unnamed protein product, partial [Prorocentrum cordatum]